MNLDDFLQEPSFSRHATKIDTIRDEFISEGCEKFLWTKFLEQKAAWEYTEKLSKKHPKVNQSESVRRFLDQFSNIDLNKQLLFFFPEDFSPYYHVAKHITQTATEVRIIDNLFAEDDTRNYMAIYDRSTKHNDDIGMLFTYTYGMKSEIADTYGGYKLFGRGLMYYYDCLEYNGHMILDYELPHKFAHFQGNSYRRDTNPYEILAARKYTKMLINHGYFNDEYELFINLHEYILPFFQKIYEDAQKRLRAEPRAYWSDIKKIKEILIEEGTIARKWKSERALYDIVKRIYPDAKFQFYPTWLEPQNLDIFIPSLNVGIEYQGRQHYEPVDFFGGEEAFRHRVELDQRKRQLCQENGTKLIEWEYTTELSKEMLKKKLSEAGVVR